MTTRSVLEFCSGRLLPRGHSRGLKRVLFLLAAGALLASAQTTQKPAAKRITTHRANELSLAGLRPGRSTRDDATALYKDRFASSKASAADQLIFQDECRGIALTIDLSKQQTIQVVRVAPYCCSTADCFVTKPSPWSAGRGLRVGDPITKIDRLYGAPDSRSPSTKDGQPLELWYYAFDWAGPDVPQVMEVLCTMEKDGQPGYVVEITLAAPSL